MGGRKDWWPFSFAETMKAFFLEKKKVEVIEPQHSGGYLFRAMQKHANSPFCCAIQHDAIAVSKRYSFTLAKLFLKLLLHAFFFHLAFFACVLVQAEILR